MVSTDNGMSWTVRPITNPLTLPSSPSTDDPSVAIDAVGTVYALFALNGTQATVAVSRDQGVTWSNIYDVGAAFGVKNVAFPAAVGGSATGTALTSTDGRAAVAFYGSTNPGCDSSADQFAGRVKVGKVNVDENSDLAIKYDVTTIPRVLIFKGSDKPMQQVVGLTAEAELVKMLDRALAS